MLKLSLLQAGMVVFNKVVTGLTNPELLGLAGGDNYTYKLNGSLGDAVEIRGGIDTDTWEDMELICILEIGGERRTASVHHLWPNLMINGTGQLIILRSLI